MHTLSLVKIQWYLLNEKWKYWRADGLTWRMDDQMDGQMDGHTDSQRDTIIPCRYRVVGYKN